MTPLIMVGRGNGKVHALRCVLATYIAVMAWTGCVWTWEEL